VPGAVGQQGTGTINILLAIELVYFETPRRALRSPCMLASWSVLQQHRSCCMHLLAAFRPPETALHFLPFAVGVVEPLV
jgi:hypothetical protein